MGATRWPKCFWKCLAGLPQTPRQTPQDLRDSRKHQSISHETCGTPANAKVFPVRLAGLPQTPKHFPRDLRDSRKRQGKRRETCGSTRKRQSISRGTCGSTRKRQGISRGTCTGGTSISKNTLVVTALYPSHSSGIRNPHTFVQAHVAKISGKGDPQSRAFVSSPIDRQEAIHSCDLYPKCRSDLATHFRPQ